MAITATCRQKAYCHFRQAAANDVAAQAFSEDVLVF